MDTDPQGSVGLSLTRQSRLLKGFYDWVEDPSISLESLIVPTRLETFSLIPCGHASDYDPGGGMGSHLARIRSLLRLISAGGYDVCLLDTAAGLFGVTSDVVTACDAVLVPQQAEPLGVRSVPKLLEGLNRLRVMNPRLHVLGVCLTMVQEDLVESTGAADALGQILPEEMLFHTRVPRDGIFVKASARGLPVGAMEDGTATMAVFDALRLEIDAKLHSSSGGFR